MKLDNVDKSRRFSKRLLADFSAGLFELLQEKKLESITIGMLCERCNYPRSTFYNYFEDIYVLMDYCWETISGQMEILDFLKIDHTERTLVLFEKVYDFMYERRPLIKKLLAHNPVDGAMVMSLNKYIRNTIYRMIIECPASYKYPVPYEIIAEHYSNTACLVLSACFLGGSTISREDALKYIDFLLGTLEKESTRK